ncbi:MAG: GNAT family N-acetyltransferase [Bacteroidia bacterium]
MPNLAARLTEALFAEAVTLPHTDIQSVVIRGCWVSLPHLSYAQWPPHTCLNEKRPDVGGNHNCHFRGTQLGLQNPYKVASWLYLKPKFKFSGALQKKINRSKQQAFQCSVGGAALLNEFWSVYARHIHRLGSLPLPKRFFHVLLQGFDEGFAEIFVLRYQGKTVGGACNLFVAGFYENAWFATDSGSQKLGASYFLHDQMISRAIELSAEVYSFGRSSPQSGVHQFKRQWGTTDIPLAWYRNGQLITENPHPLRPLGKLLKYLPFPLVALLGNWAFKRIY